MFNLVSSRLIPIRHKILKEEVLLEWYADEIALLKVGCQEFGHQKGINRYGCPQGNSGILYSRFCHW
jgi:hypothetical protein